LRDIEDGKALQERDRLRLLAGLLCPPLLVVGGETVGIDNSCAMFAFTNIAAEAERLAEGDPALDRETVLYDGSPKDQHVDPRIAPSGCSILRHRERRLGCRCPPRLDPGDTASLQLADDFCGDFVV
jgi:hypothetical protein